MASSRSDISIANSNNTKSRITKYYRKKSNVLYPPVETERFNPPPNPLPCKEGEKKEENYYIIISALTEFKKIEVAIN
jgi:glycosyltransferase involved in cell wall biosynthesis